MASSARTPVTTTIYREFHALFKDHWQRPRRFLGPCQVWLTLMLMSAGGVKGYGRALQEMKRTMGRFFAWDGKRPSPAALSQARNKLTRAMCDDAMRLVSAGCTTARAYPRVRFGRWNLVACDGTSLNLPVASALKRHYGVPRCSHGDCLVPQAALTMLFDVGTHQPRAFSLERCRYPERRALLDLVSHLRPEDLLIADRGYPSRALFAALCTHGQAFLMRTSAMHSNSIAECRAFLASGQSEATVDLPLLTAAQREAAGGSAALRLRFIRFHDDSVLVTSLTAQDAGAEDLRQLYLDRWRIETAFGEMKGFRGLEDFHARTPLGIYQEVTAVVLFMMLESELEARAHQHHAQEIAQDTAISPGGRRQATNIRFNRLLMGDWVLSLMIDATKGERLFKRTLREALDDLWRARSRHRPGRSFPRQTKSPYGKWRLKPRVKPGLA